MIGVMTGVGIGAISGIAGFVISKQLSKRVLDLYEKEALAKAKVIDHEAQIILKDAQLNAKKDYEKEMRKARYEYNDMFAQIEKKEREVNNILENELRDIKIQKTEISKNHSEIANLKDAISKQKKSYEDSLDEVLKVLENASGLTEEEAKEIMIKQVKENNRAEISHVFRKQFQLAQKTEKDKASKILAIAVTRYAGEFAAERLVNHLTIDSDEVKGKIIGKEGRNIKALEMLLGVDIIIDDTPNTITVSSFNLLRRAIATKTLGELLKDGRIQPARIEEIYNKVASEFDANMQKEGEDVLLDLGIKSMHPELVKLVGRLRYRASYGQNALAHTLEVAHLSGLIAGEMGGDTILARRAGLMHDIGKALTHDMPGSHVDIGAEICKRYNEHEVVINAIYAHHDHEEPKTVEAAAVCAADALSAARPGARREVLESFLKRVEEIENIATSKKGVNKAYAINAGREIRVFVNAQLINDDEAVLLSSEIAKEVEEKVQYPGEVKVNVIRETRAIGYAR